MGMRDINKRHLEGFIDKSTTEKDREVERQTETDKRC